MAPNFKVNRTSYLEKTAIENPCVLVMMKNQPMVLLDNNQLNPSLACYFYQGVAVAYKNNLL